MGARRWSSVAVATVVATLAAACGADRIVVGPSAPAPIDSPAPHHLAPTAPRPGAATGTCDRGGMYSVYRPLVRAFNDGVPVDVDQYFAASPHFEYWWDPSDALGKAQARPDLAAHFRAMYALGVRLPVNVAFMPTGDTGVYGFDQDGFIGGGHLDCVTGKITNFVIDAWPRSVAGRAPHR